MSTALPKIVPAILRAPTLMLWQGTRGSSKRKAHIPICGKAHMAYTLDPSALGLVSSGFLSPASRANAGGALGHGNCAGAICVCARGR